MVFVSTVIKTDRSDRLYHESTRKSSSIRYKLHIVRGFTSPIAPSFPDPADPDDSDGFGGFGGSGGSDGFDSGHLVRRGELAAEELDVCQKEEEHSLVHPGRVGRTPYF